MVGRELAGSALVELADIITKVQLSTTYVHAGPSRGSAEKPSTVHVPTTHRSAK